ncbi:MAG TPA: clostripain-related cysteine peptidase [Chryseosolibacter sp.]|nr:clostripain-related cysteine peptidase [Chryseosolibacter sp.]
MKKSFILACIVALTTIVNIAIAQHNWTILYYAAGCNSSEETLLQDLNEIKNATRDNQGYRIITLIDRVEGFSSDANTFGEDFTDTRLYEITEQNFRRVSGRELLPEITNTSVHDANMGDANTLKRFIMFGKKYYPASHYALFVYSHGDGISFSADIESDRDALYPAEITDVLTAQESVSLIAMDVCSMAGIEVAYQWRPQKNKFGANYLVASAPVSAPWDYASIFNRLSKSGAQKKIDPTKMSPEDFGNLLIEEIYNSQPWCSWGFFDLSKAGKVKSAIDSYIKANSIDSHRKVLKDAQTKTIEYLPTFDAANASYYRMRIPYFDAFDLFRQLKDHNPVDNTAVDDILTAIDELVVQSFYATGGNFLKPTDHFVNGQNGVYIFFPFGKELYPYSNKIHWAEQKFYSPKMFRSTNSYGNLMWCADGATGGNGKVENWFELLDAMFDDHRLAAGDGYNGYHY